MPDTERELLRDHQARTVPVVPAWLALPLGVALMAGGVALVLVGAGALPVVPRSDVPPAVPYSVGVVFVVVGAWLIAVKLGDGLRRARARRLRRSLPGALWLADHPWSTITLRCIEERYETRAGDESTWTASYQLHADRLEIDPAWGRMAGQWNVPVTFMLPAAPFETSLSARPPRYWELAVHGESPGVDFDATFLVPIYATTSASDPRAG